MKEEWPKFHLPLAVAKGKGTLGYASWTQIKDRGRGLAVMKYCHLYYLAGHLTTLSEARTHTQLTSATFKMITVEIIIHSVSL